MQCYNLAAQCFKLRHAHSVFDVVGSPAGQLYVPFKVAPAVIDSINGTGTWISAIDPRTSTMKL